MGVGVEEQDIEVEVQGGGLWLQVLLELLELTVYCRCGECAGAG